MLRNNNQWTLQKNNDPFVDIVTYDDGTIDLELHGDVPSQIEDMLVGRLLVKGFMELEDDSLEKAKKKKKKKKNWQPKAKHKSDKGGLTAAGRKSYNKQTGGNLKAPQPGGGPRKRSFCARNAGQIKQHNIDCRANPDKRACKARRRWKC